jgi:hypothetical protein
MTTTVNPRPALRTQRKGRILLWGKSGAGKTLTALKLARGLAGPDGTICVIDTDYEASMIYADTYVFDIQSFDPPFHPDRFTETIKTVGPHYDVLVLDTGTHEWTGEGGCLEIRDREALRLKDNSWAAWAKVTPAHQRFLEALMRCPAHLIVTLRAKTVTEQVKDEKTGKVEVHERGLFPVQRYEGEEFAYGLDISGRLDSEGQGVQLSITNTRYQAWHGASFTNPDEALGAELATWLNQGVAPPVPRPPAEPSESPAAIDDRERTGVEVHRSRPPGHLPGTPPGEQPRRASQREDPPPDAGRRTAPQTRGEVLGAITTELFRLVPRRGDDGRRQRMAVLDETFGAQTMRDVAKLADDVLREGLRRLQAKTPETPAPQKPGRQWEREPGEEG